MVMRIQDYDDDTILIEDGEQQLFVAGEIKSFKPEKGALVCGYCGKAATALNLRRTPNGSEIECPHCNRHSAVLNAGIRIS
jgi:hypothetical protein